MYWCGVSKGNDSSKTGLVEHTPGPGFTVEIYDSITTASQDIVLSYNIVCAASNNENINGSG